MIKALCCYHTTPDFSLLSEDEWIFGSKLGIVDISYLKKRINCFDESGLELALRFSESCREKGLTSMSFALSIGNDDNSMCKSLVAAGFNSVVNISFPNSLLTFSSESVSRTLSDYAKKEGGYDLYILGCESEDANQGKVPFLFAEMLGIPCYNQVRKIEPVTETTIRITYAGDDGIYQRCVSTPVVLVIGNAADTYLRVPTLKQRIAVDNSKIKNIDINDISDEQSLTSLSAPYELKSLTPNIFHRNATVVKGNPSECAKRMLDYYSELTAK